MGDGITVNFTDAASFKIDSIGNATSASISLEVLRIPAVVWRLTSNRVNRMGLLLSFKLPADNGGVGSIP